LLCCYRVLRCLGQQHLGSSASPPWC
jgi:hypothetical protein